MAMARLLILLTSIAFLLAACDDIPADPGGTTQRVEETGIMKVGFVAGDEGLSIVPMELFAARIAEVHDARIEAREGTEGTLLRALEEMQLDLVVGVFPEKSPWKERVKLTSAVARPEPDKETPVLRGAVPLGENRWLLSIERVIEGGDLATSSR